MQEKRIIITAYRLLLIAVILYGLYLSFFVPLQPFEPGEQLPPIVYFTIQSNILVVLALL